MRRRVLILLIVAFCGAALYSQGRGRGGAETQIKPGEECPAGMTEIRPGRCQAPATPPPSILDYRPKSTVVAKETPTPKAKFPVIDIHNHINISDVNVDEMIKAMDALNLRVLVNLSGGSGDELQKKIAYIRSSPHKDRFRVFANVAWGGVGTPGWADREVAKLRQAVKDGAIGLKIFKDLGLRVRKADGSRLKIDDPEIGPVWNAAGELKIPVIIHTADPAEFFKPVDFKNERWLELALNPGRAYSGLSFEELSGERDRMFLAHKKTTFIGAHFNWYGNDLGKVAKQLDETPNLVLEVGAVLYEFGRQPRASRDFFIKYQDRVLFGKDAYEPTEYPYYWRVFETKDEYFDYYRDYHAFWKLYGMDLPDDVLKKVYYKNALRVTPGLPQSGWPQ